MSNAAMACAWESADRPTASGPLFVLIVLTDHASDHSGEDWTAFPSVERIAARTQFSRATVERHLAALFAAGWISRKRRVRLDGKLGIYDYVVHREMAVREALRAARKAEAEGGPESAEPCCNLQHGPCCNLDETMLQKNSEPCCKLQHQEPLEEPLVEPTERAREPGDAGFEEGFAAWPDVGRKRTDIPAARAAWAMAAGEIGAEDLIGRVRRYVAEDADLKTGTRGAAGLQRWLSGERWRAWAPVATTADAADGPGSRTGFADGPPDWLRDEVSALAGAGFVVAYLDRCRWIVEGEDRALQPATGIAFDNLRRRVFAVLRKHGIELVDPASVARSGGNS